MAKQTVTILQERVESSILLIRGEKVILDRDLARLYGVTTKALNQAVKRNSEAISRRFHVPAHCRRDAALVAE